MRAKEYYYTMMVSTKWFLKNQNVFVIKEFHIIFRERKKERKKEREYYATMRTLRNIRSRRYKWPNISHNSDVWTWKVASKRKNVLFMDHDLSYDLNGLRLIFFSFSSSSFLNHTGGGNRRKSFHKKARAASLRLYKCIHSSP